MRKFKPVFLSNYSVDDAWFDLLYAIYTKGRKYTITAGSYKGAERYSLDYVAGYIQNPHNPVCPYVSPHLGIPAPTTEQEIQEYFLNYLMKGELEKNEHYKYGTFLVGGNIQMPPETKETRSYYPNGDIENTLLNKAISIPNMVEWVIDHFKKHGYGNEHCYINIGYSELNLGYEVPYDDETSRLTSPCLRGIGFKIIKAEDNHYYLQTDVTFRSWDAVGGWPTNIGGIALLNQYIASFLDDVQPGSIAYSSKSLHAYSFHIDYLKARLNK